MGSQEGGDGGASSGNTADQAKTDSLFENRPRTKKIIRVVTVMAYMVSVSFVAIVLSGYYVFLWQPPNPRLLHRAHLRADPQIDYRIDNDADPRVMDIDERIDMFREQVLRNRGINIVVPTNINVKVTNRDGNESRDESTTIARNETRDNNSEIMGKSMVRAFLGAKTDALTTDEERTTAVYENVNKTAMNNSGSHGALGLFTKGRVIDDQISTNPKVSFFRRNDKLYEQTLTKDSRANKNVKSDVNAGRNVIVSDNRETTSHDSREHLAESTRQNDTDDRSIKYEKSVERNVTYDQRMSNEIQKDETIRKLDNGMKKLLESTIRPNKIGSQIARVPITHLVTNDSFDPQRHETKLPVKHPSTYNPANFIADEMESVRESSDIESSPLIVRSKPPSSKEEQKAPTEQDMSDFNSA